MESQDSPHGSSEERREEERQTKGIEKRDRESVMKMKEGAMGEEKDESHRYLKNR